MSQSDIQVSPPSPNPIPVRVLDYRTQSQSDLPSPGRWIFFWLLLPGVAVPFLPISDGRSALHDLKLLQTMRELISIGAISWWIIAAMVWWGGMFFLWVLLPFWRLILIRFKRLTQQRIAFYVLFGGAIFPNLVAAYVLFKGKALPKVYQNYICAASCALGITFFLIMALRKRHPQRIAVAALLIPALSHSTLVLAALYEKQIGSGWYLLLWCTLIGSIELFDFAIRPTFAHRNQP